MQLLVLPPLVAVLALATAQNSNSIADENPCALLTTSAQSQSKGSAAEFKPSEVYACLKDVPLNRTAAVAQIEWIQNFVQFQTTLAYLKDPTPEYQLPPIDIVGGLSKIGQDADDGKYDNEFDFELDIFNLIAHADDGHFIFEPFLIQGFGYNRTFGLVSVSMNGLELPKIYIQAEIEGYAQSLTGSRPSPIQSINGQDVDAYLQAIGYLSLSQDLDAQYNILLYNPAASVLGASNLFQSPSRFVSHDDSTVITYQNGTSATIMAKAKAASDVKFGFQNGQDLYNSLLKPDANSATSNSTSATSSSASSPTATTSQGQKTKPNPLKPVGPGFPVPIVKHSGNYVSGYFLNGSDAGDVAVMAISSFDAQTEGPISEFQRDVQEFLSMCRTSGKRNLIIDVRGNPGGSVILAYDTFKQLFPSIVPYSGIRTRASPAMNALGQIVSDQGTIIGDVAGGLIFDAQSFLKSPDGPYYQNWDQLNGPIELHGDNFTNIASWEFFNATRNPSFSQGVTVSGYGNRTNLPPQAFASKAITLLTDGSCASTCADFANLLINQGGDITTVAAGGRPNTSPMAVIGGTQGGNILQYPTFKRIVAITLLTQLKSKTLSAAQKLKNAALLTPLIKPAPINYYPSSTAPSINLVDNIAKGDASMTPLQFTKSPVADCRFWYMPRDIVDVENTWMRVVNGLKMGGKGLCVNGGLASSGSGGGNATSAFGSSPNGVATGSLGRSSSSAAFAGAANLLGAPLSVVAVGLGVGLMWVL